MRPEVENVISGGVKQTVVDSDDFKNFLTDHGLYEKEYAPRTRKGTAVINGKLVKFNVTAENKIGDIKTITYEGEKHTVTIEDIETIEENIENYPYIDASNTENYGFHYQEVPITLTKEEEIALYDYYASTSDTTKKIYKEKPIATILNVIGIILCIVGFISGIVVAAASEFVGLMFIIWIVTFVQVILLFAIATAIESLNRIQWKLNA